MDSVSGVVVAACVEAARVVVVVGCMGAEVEAAWVVMVIVEVGLVVKTSVVGFGARLLE